MTDQTPERHEPRTSPLAVTPWDGVTHSFTMTDYCDHCGCGAVGSPARCERRSGEERRTQEGEAEDRAGGFSMTRQFLRSGTDRRAARQWFREYTNSSLVEAMYEWHDQSEAPDEVRSYLQQLADHLLGAPPAVEDGGEDADTLLHIADDIFRYSDSRDAGWASASIVALREIAARLRGSTEDDMGEMAEQFRKGWEAGHRAATEDEGRTVYYARCGWCGAYEGTVDPREACAQDPATGEFIGPHQFAVYEAALTPEPTEEEG